MAPPIKTPTRNLNKVLRTYVSQTIWNLHLTTTVQKVFPDEVYPGFTGVNKWRKKTGRWFSTGQGAVSFKGNVASATPDDATMIFTYDDHLRFVDMGVGQGTKYEDVDSAKKAHYKRRYIRVWDRRKGRSQRPAIMMEFRHLQRRLTKHLADYYGTTHEAYIVRTFDQKTIELLF